VRSRRSIDVKRNMLAIIVIVVIVAAAILLTPVALAGAVTVPVSQIAFSENTGGGSVKLGGGCYNPNMVVLCNSTTSSITVYQYYFLTRSGGVLRSTDTKVNSTAGSTNVTISMFLTTPSQLVNLGNMTISGGVGNRTHTVNLGIDQGVRASGTYKLTITVDASILLAGSTKVAKSAAGFETTFKVP
jgi:hypothetical protein